MSVQGFAATQEPEISQAPATNDSPVWVSRPSGTEPPRVVWPYVVAILGFHLLLPLAFVPWLFTWTGLLLIPIGNYVFCSLGIGAGYHRLLAHRSYQCPKWWERFLALLGVCSLMEGPARWVMIHRKHHQYSDQAEDPHTPMAGWFWGHLKWLTVENRALSSLESYERYVPDMLQDRFYRKLERGLNWLWVYLIHAILFFVTGFAIGWARSGSVMEGAQFGSSLLLWGVIFRTIYTWHITWAVNSVTHRWGYRNFETEENSRNNWIFGLATNGEGWHNNHHADPGCCAQGFYRWWELDITYLTIKFWQMIGLAWNVVPRRRHQMAREQTT